VRASWRGAWNRAGHVAKGVCFSNSDLNAMMRCAGPHFCVLCLSEYFHLSLLFFLSFPFVVFFFYFFFSPIFPPPSSSSISSLHQRYHHLRLTPCFHLMPFSVLFSACTVKFHTVSAAVISPAPGRSPTCARTIVFSASSPPAWPPKNSSSPAGALLCVCPVYSAVFICIFCGSSELLHVAIKKGSLKGQKLVASCKPPFFECLVCCADQ